MGRPQYLRGNRPFPGRPLEGNVKDGRPAFQRMVISGKDADWMAWIQKLKESGLGQAEFCRQHDLNPLIFANRKRKLLALHDHKPTSHPSEQDSSLADKFILLRLEVGAQRRSAREISFPDGKVLHFQTLPGPEYLRCLLRPSQEG